MKPFWCRKDWKWQVIHNSKPALLQVLNQLNKVLPEPTKEDCHLENSRVLCDVRDEFFKHLNISKDRENALRAIWNFGIIMHEHDEPYRDMMDWIKEEIDKYPWEPLSPVHPTFQIWRRFK